MNFTNLCPDVQKMIFEMLIPDYEIYRIDQQNVMFDIKLNKVICCDEDDEISEYPLEKLRNEGFQLTKIPSNIKQYIENLCPFEIYHVCFANKSYNYYDEEMEYGYDYNKNVIILKNEYQKEIYQTLFGPIVDEKDDFELFYELDLVINPKLIKRICNMTKPVLTDYEEYIRNDPVEDYILSMLITSVERIA